MILGHSRRIEPGPGQESVWDYPRPPRLEPVRKHIQIVFNGVTLADTRRAYRVLETSHPPVYYLPPDDIQMQYLSPAPGAVSASGRARRGTTPLRWATGSRKLPRGTTRTRRRSSCRYATTSPFTRHAWMPASWTASA